MSDEYLQMLLDTELCVQMSWAELIKGKNSSQLEVFISLSVVVSDIMSLKVILMLSAWNKVSFFVYGNSL